MSILISALGIFLILAVLYDVAITTLTIGGGGPITSRLSNCLWRIAIKIHQYRSNHKLLTMLGWIILIGITASWFIVVWTGWVLIFSSVDTAIVNTENKLTASLLERIYFVGYALSTLGLGDYIPQGAIWQLATPVMSVNGFLLVSLSITYLLPVVSSAAQGRQFATYVTSLGGTPDEILARAWNGKNFGQLEQHLIQLSPMLLLMAEQHLTYPILYYFHTSNRARAVALSFAALDEALTLLQYGVAESHRLEPSVLGSARRATTAFLQTISSAYIEPAQEDPPFPELTLVKLENIPVVSEQDFHEALRPLTQRRRLLLALIQSDGWSWDNIASRRTTGRGISLDDNTELKKISLS